MRKKEEKRVNAQTDKLLLTEAHFLQLAIEYKLIKVKKEEDGLAGHSKLAVGLFVCCASPSYVVVDARSRGAARRDVIS